MFFKNDYTIINRFNEHKQLILLIYTIQIQLPYNAIAYIISTYVINRKLYINLIFYLYSNTPKWIMIFSIGKFKYLWIYS